MITFACPHCGTSLKVQPGLAGRNGKCARCAKRITVPRISPAAMQAVTAPASSSHADPPANGQQPSNGQPAAIDSALPRPRRRMLRAALIVGSSLLIAASAAGITYYIDPEILGFAGPGKTVLDFVEAYNEKDVNRMLSLVNSRVESGVKLVDKVSPLASMFGIDTKNVLKAVPFLAPIAGKATGASQLENVRIERKSITGSIAKVTAILDHRYIVIQGEHVSQLKVLFTVEHEELGWRIHWVELQ
jgi:predicted Zn finger-like uncharacterized protein